MNLPPTIMWDPARNQWDQTALLLLEAFQMYSDSLCSSCGQSAFFALDVAYTREFSVHTALCNGCNSLETHRENHSDEQVKGEKAYVASTVGESETQ